MLDCIAQRILSELPEVKFITKHDSVLPAGIMVTGGISEVERILLEVIEQVTGIRPQLKLKGATSNSTCILFSYKYPYPLCVQNLCN